MTTENKDFKVKHGLIVQGSSATVSGNQVLTTASNIEDLANVNSTVPNDGSVLTYNLGLATWYPSSPAPANIEISTTPPEDPQEGDLWFDSTELLSYVFYDGFWVETSPAIAGPTGPAGPVGDSPNNTKFYVSGRYYGHVSTGGLVGSTAPYSTLGRALFTVFYVTNTVTFDRIGLTVNTGSSGSTIRLGIYNADPITYQPSTVVLDAGLVDAGTSGTKQIIISQTLSPGYYYLASVRQEGGLAPSVSTSNVTFHSPFYGGLTVNDGRNLGFLKDGITAGLTENNDLLTTISSAPILGLRAV